MMISWIDNSPEKLRRQDALKKRERQDRGDEEREWRGIREQIKRAKRDGGDSGEESEGGEEGEGKRTLTRAPGEKITLNFTAKKTATPAAEISAAQDDAVAKPPSPPLTDENESPPQEPAAQDTSKPTISLPSKPTTNAPPPNALKAPVKFTNPLLSAPKKNPLLAASKKAKSSKPLQPEKTRPMSEAERIMREEMERKARREERGGGKRQRVG